MDDSGVNSGTNSGLQVASSLVARTVSERSSQDLCQRILRGHVDCVKKFILEARADDKAYEPGTYGPNDRCGITRHEYVSCIQGAKPTQERQTWNQVKPQASYMDQHLGIGGSTTVGGYAVQQTSGVKSSNNVARTASSHAHPCSSELNLFGRCVENSLQKGLSKYIFIDNNSGTDKCFHKRTVFDQCMNDFKESGWNYGTGGNPIQSTKLARSFSVGGRFVELK